MLRDYTNKTKQDGIINAHHLDVNADRALSVSGGACVDVLEPLVLVEEPVAVVLIADEEDDDEVSPPSKYVRT